MQNRYYCVLQWRDRKGNEKEKRFSTYDAMFSFVCQHSHSRTVWDVTMMPKRMYIDSYDGEIFDKYATRDYDYNEIHAFMIMDTATGKIVDTYTYYESEDD